MPKLTAQENIVYSRNDKRLKSGKNGHFAKSQAKAKHSKMNYFEAEKENYEMRVNETIGIFPSNKKLEKTRNLR